MRTPPLPFAMACMGACQDQRLGLSLAQNSSAPPKDISSSQSHTYPAAPHALCTPQYQERYQYSPTHRYSQPQPQPQQRHKSHPRLRNPVEWGPSPAERLVPNGLPCKSVQTNKQVTASATRLFKLAVNQCRLYTNHMKGYLLVRRYAACSAVALYPLSTRHDTYSSAPPIQPLHLHAAVFMVLHRMPPRNQPLSQIIRYKF
jgi:hypothetical protein